MRKIQLIVISGVALFFSCASALADQIYVSTQGNSGYNTWSGTLKRIDANSNLVYFTCDDAPDNYEYPIHITRIISVLFQNDGGGYDGGSCFPKTQFPMAMPLAGANPRKVSSFILSNGKNYTTRFPSVVPDAHNDIMLSGVLVSATEDQIGISSASDANKKTGEVKVSRDDLVNWRR